MLFFDEAAVRLLLPMAKAVELLESAFASLAKGEAKNQPRRRLFTDSGTVLHSLAGACGPYLGTKVYSTNPKHGAWFLFWLLDAATGRPLALFEADALGQIRTGAASGVATKLLANPNAQTVGLIGSGFQARAQLEAVLAVRPISEVRIWSRNREKCEKFAKDFGPLVAIADSASDAVRNTQIVITATNAKDPVFAASDIAAGTHINVMGSNHPARREVPSDLFERCSRIVADSVEACRIEAGDLLLGLDEAGWARVEELAGAAARQSPTEITLFKSVGLGLEDVAVAGYIYEIALASGSAPSIPAFAM